MRQKWPQRHIETNCSRLFLSRVLRQLASNGGQGVCKLALSIALLPSFACRAELFDRIVIQVVIIAGILIIGGLSSEGYNKMEENISYRKIKKQKPYAIKSTSQRLLHPIFRNRTQDSTMLAHNDIMSQNVTQYQYMLSDPHLKENYINWATNLRGYDHLPPKEQPAADPPAVFFKDTTLQKMRKECKAQNKTQYSQYFGKDTTNIPENDVKFVSELRKMDVNDHEKEKQRLTHGEIFKNYGGGQRGSLPRLLKKSSIKKVRNINQSDYEEEIDGTHKYPQYTYKNLREKNSALITALSKSHDTISLPGLAWSVGLRSYS